ncbi:MarR family winged helix-turn-helix transcriptional regulator [Enemella evansiae]|uniref:MarR family winged helix-turn-helix transcriptional regulator n=2 Tax=Enemella evansiae TaxID=2016499 RepID=UPI000B966CD8|nr:MarR family transcriptional regulator [Enemella evansiae]OYN96279.1 hypothetical protein CGZ96_13540 [Enemella evansiae]OYO01795.1 hypothetical protein CGZ97_15340 [Enemella evansiae]OYO19715.1 hypothetical protein BI335_04180 [Enemella evansiae]PFG65511.1 DNA-binding MarR family transcriptional regulator [Propionibacteriaceae bacterium ES.041]
MNARAGATSRTREDRARMDALDALLRASIELRRHIEQVARDFEISAPQARLLLILEEPMRMQHAAEATACEPSHLTALADQLQRAGLITREPDPDDRRARRLSLTERGRAVRTALAPAMLDGAPVIGSLDARECEELRTLIDTRLVRAPDPLGVKPPSDA